MTVPSGDRSPGSPGSPAVAVTAVAGLLGLLLSLNTAAFPVALFLAAVSLAALPLALADRAGGRRTAFALVGALSAVLALALVLVPLLLQDGPRAARTGDPLRDQDAPVLPAPPRPTQG